MARTKVGWGDPTERLLSGMDEFEVAVTRRNREYSSRMMRLFHQLIHLSTAAVAIIIALPHKLG